MFVFLRKPPQHLQNFFPRNRRQFIRVFAQGEVRGQRTAYRAGPASVGHKGRASYSLAFELQKNVNGVSAPAGDPALPVRIRHPPPMPRVSPALKPELPEGLAGFLKNSILQGL